MAYLTFARNRPSDFSVGFGEHQMPTSFAYWQRLSRWPILGGVIVALIMCVWHFVYQPLHLHSEWERDVREDLKTLVNKRPPHIPAGQWEFMVGWTLNMHFNCAGIYTSVNLPRGQIFAASLKERLKNPIDDSLIDWIWDEYAECTKLGKNYSDKYRPTRSPDLQRAEPGCFNLPVQ